MYTVYMYTNVENGKRYVGRTKNTLSQRAKNGTNYKGSRVFNDAIDKYGWSAFEPTILAECETRAEANNLERFYIDLYKTQNPEFGYNIEAGGELGPQADSTKAKISENAKERYKDKTKNPNYGKHWSEDFKQEMRERFSGENGYWYGKHWSEEHKQYLSQLFKGTHKTIRKKPYTEEELEHCRAQMKKNSEMWAKKVRCVEDDIVFDTITEAARYYNRDISCICAVLNGRQKTSAGKTFEYVT